MKKTILSVLLVLLLSFVILGCKDEEEEYVFSAETDTALKSFGITPKDILKPANCTFSRHEVTIAAFDDYIHLIWTGADSTKYTAYETAWSNAPVKNLSSKSAREITVGGTLAMGDKTDFDSANIFYYSEGGTDAYGVTVPTNSIVLVGSQKN